jgi:hypothetical protein
MRYRVWTLLESGKCIVLGIRAPRSRAVKLSIVQVRPGILVICLHFSGVVAAKNVFQAVGLVSLVRKGRCWGEAHGDRSPCYFVLVSRSGAESRSVLGTPVFFVSYSEFLSGNQWIQPHFLEPLC